MKTATITKETKEKQLHDLLMNQEGTIPIEKALSDAKKRWQK